MSASSEDIADSGAGLDTRKGAWTAKEDAALSNRVSKYGTKSWTIISAGVEGRSAKSCRLRWYNQLCPGVKRTPFSEWEQAVIIKAQKVHTNKWAALAKLLKGRTDNAIKNHWNATLSRKLNNPAENFKNQFIEQGVTLEWLLEHPELDTSNDIEEALGHYHKGYPAVVKALRKKKRRSTPDSPSYSMSPSPPPASKPKIRASNRQTLADHQGLEGGCESGISSETTPPTRRGSGRPAAAAAGFMAAAAPDLGFRQDIPEDLGGYADQRKQQQCLQNAGYVGSNCYSPCSQTAAAAAAAGESPGAMTNHPVGMAADAQGCVIGPDGMCCCQPDAWQRQQQQQYSYRPASMEDRCSYPDSGPMQWQQEQEQQQQQQQQQPYYGGSNFGSMMHPPGNTIDHRQQQQQQQQQFQSHDSMLYKSSSFVTDTHMQDSSCNRFAVTAAVDQQQQSGSSMSSGSPIRPGTALIQPGSATQLPPAAAAAADGSGGVYGSLIVPDRSYSSTDLPADAAANSSTAVLPGIPIMDRSSHRPGLPAMQGDRNPAAAAAAGSWGVSSYAGVTAGPGISSFAPSDCLGPLRVRPLAGQGKLLSPAAYDMMVAGMSAANSAIELQLMAESAVLPGNTMPSSYSCHPTVVGGLGHSAGQLLSPRGSGGGILAQARSMPPSLGPSGLRPGSSGSSPDSHPSRQQLGRSHSYTYGGFDSGSSSGPVHRRSSSGGHGSNAAPAATWAQHDMCCNSSYDRHADHALGSGHNAASYPSGPNVSYSTSSSMLHDLPPIPRAHSIPGPFISNMQRQQPGYTGVPHCGDQGPYAGGSSAGRSSYDHFGITPKPYSAAATAGFSSYGPRPDFQKPRAEMLASLGAEAPVPGLIRHQQQQQQQQQQQITGLNYHGPGPVPQIKPDPAGGYSQQPGLSPADQDHMDVKPDLDVVKPDPAATERDVGWDNVNECLSEVFADGGDAESFDWENFDIPDLKSHDVEELLML